MKRARSIELEGLEEDSEFECCICQEVLPCSKSLAEHLSSHAEDPEKEREKRKISLEDYLNGDDISETDLDVVWLASDKSCPLCQKKSRSAPLLKTHYERHYNVTFRCHCQKTFSSMKTLATHLQTHSEYIIEPSDSHKTFLCLLCAASFNTVNGMKDHLSESPDCGRKWSEANSLETSDSVLTISTFICALCQEAFNDWETMNSHVEDHYNPKYLCSCKVTVDSELGIKSHSALIHNSLNSYSRTFNCLTCESSFSSIENMEKHLRLPFNAICLTTWKTLLTKTPKCQIREESDSQYHTQYVCKCRLSFKLLESCHAHSLEKNCTYSKFYVCNNCTAMYTQLVDLKEHLNVYKECCQNSKREKTIQYYGKPIPDKLVTCELCKKNFVSKNSLDAHMEKHYNVVYICACLQSFSHNEFTTHCFKEHNKLVFNMKYDKVFKCNCGYQSNDLGDIKAHVECSGCVLNDNQVNNDFLFSCPLCPKVLTTKTSLRCHHDKHYNVLFTCSCSKQFKLFKGFETHCTVEHNQTPSRVDHIKKFICFHCEFTVDTIEELGDHLKGSEGCFMRWEIELLRFSMKCFIEEKKRFACHICQKSFDQKAQIRDHLESHFNVRYTCRRCARVLTSKSNFRVHSARTHGLSMKTVGYDKKFVCHFCSREFKQVEAVDKHVMLHNKNSEAQTGQKVLEDFKCKDCRCVFKTAKSLRHHIAYFRGIDMKCTDNKAKKMQLSNDDGPLFVDVESGGSSMEKEVMLTSEVTIQPRPNPSDPLCS